MNTGLHQNTQPYYNTNSPVFIVPGQQSNNPNNWNNPPVAGNNWNNPPVVGNNWNNPPVAGSNWSPYNDMPPSYSDATEYKPPSAPVSPDPKIFR